VDSFVNCLFAIIATPLVLFLVGYGIYLIPQARTDQGVFLILLGVLLLAAVASGYVSSTARGRRRGAKSEASARKKASK